MSADTSVKDSTGTQPAWVTEAIAKYRASEEASAERRLKDDAERRQRLSKELAEALGKAGVPTDKGYSVSFDEGDRTTVRASVNGFAFVYQSWQADGRWSSGLYLAVKCGACGRTSRDGPLRSAYELGAALSREEPVYHSCGNYEGDLNYRPVLREPPSFEQLANVTDSEAALLDSLREYIRDVSGVEA